MRKDKGQRRCPTCGQFFEAHLAACPNCSLAEEDRTHHTVLKGRYRILARIDTRGRSRSYLARDEQQSRQVIIRMIPTRLDPAGVALWKKRARILQRLMHPAMAKLCAFESEGDPRFLVFEHAPGRRLDGVLSEAGPLPLERVVEIARALAGALDEAAASGLLLEQLDLRSVVVDAKWNPRIVDVDLSRWSEDEKEEEPAGRRRRPDIAALATLLYQCLSGREPFAPERAEGEVRFGNPFPIEGVSSHVYHALAIALGEPERYTDAAHFVRVLSGKPLPPPLGRSAEIKQAPREHFRPLAGAVILAVAILAGVWLYVRGAKPSGVIPPSVPPPAATRPADQLATRPAAQPATQAALTAEEALTIRRGTAQIESLLSRIEALKPDPSQRERIFQQVTLVTGQAQALAAHDFPAAIEKLDEAQASAQSILTEVSARRKLADDLATARQVFDKLMEEYGEEAQNLSETAAARGKLADAAEAIAERRLDEAEVLLTEANRSLRDVDQKLETRRNAAESLALLDQARARKDDRDRRGAIEALKQALALDPGNAEAEALLAAVRAMLPRGFVAADGSEHDPETGLPLAIICQTDASEMVLVTPGRFLRGSNKDAEENRPQALIHLDAFYIDRYEISNAQFENFVLMTSHSTEAERAGHSLVWRLGSGGQYSMRSTVNAGWRFPRGGRSERGREKPDHPVVHVTIADAQAYCRWSGKSLPTEAQWEKAARGTDGRVYPWGDEPPGLKRANYWPQAGPDADGARYTAPVKDYPAGASPYGCLNMSGNVRELCADFYDPEAHKKSQDDKPATPEKGTFRVVRGGAWHDTIAGSIDPLASCSRLGIREDASDSVTGFRCVMVP